MFDDLLKLIGQMGLRPEVQLAIQTTIAQKHDPVGISSRAGIVGHHYNRLFKLIAGLA